MPERCIKELFSTRGSAIVMALLIFLIISVLAVSVISVAAMENKISLYDANKEQARMAADAGVEVARNVILNYLGAGKTVADAGNALNTELDLGNGGFARVTLDNSEYESKGIIKITSRGKLQKSGEELAHRTAEAKMLINVIPNAAVHTNEFAVYGKYYLRWERGLLPTAEWVDWRTYGFKGPKAADYDNLTDERLKERSDFMLWDDSGTQKNPDKSYWWARVESEGSSLSGTLRVYCNRYETAWYRPQGVVNFYHKIDKDKLAPLAIYHFRVVENLEELDENDEEQKKKKEELQKLYFNWDKQIEIAEQRAAFYKWIERWSGGNWFDFKFEQNLPPKILDSRDFLGNHANLDITEGITKPPVFGEEEVQRYRERAKTEVDGNWAYIEGDSSLLTTKTIDGRTKKVLILDQIINEDNKKYIGKPFIFVDTTDDLVLDFRTYDSSKINLENGWLIPWSNFNGFVNKINNQVQTFLRLFSNDLAGIIIVTPANVEFGIDSMLFEPRIDEKTDKQVAIAVLSGGKVDVSVNPKSFNGINRLDKLREGNPDKWKKTLRMFILAGEKARVTSTLGTLHFEGIISAHEQVEMHVDYFDAAKLSSYAFDKEINFYYDPIVLDDFPEPMAYLGIGPIISYKYIK